MSPDAQTRAAMVEAAIRGVDWPNTPEYRMRILRGITAAILAAETRGFKLVGYPTDAEVDAFMGSVIIGANSLGNVDGAISVARDAAPGWGDGT